MCNFWTSSSKIKRGVLSQRIFQKWQLPKGIFPSMASSQMCKRQLPESVIAAVLTLVCSSRSSQPLAESVAPIAAYSASEGLT